MSTTLDDVAALLREAMDDELADLDIDRDTSFSDDLEIESIELVALAELMADRWDDVDVTAWLATMSIDEIIGLTVGDLVAFVDSCRS